MEGRFVSLSLDSLSLSLILSSPSLSLSLSLSLVYIFSILVFSEFLALCTYGVYVCMLACMCVCIGTSKYSAGRFFTVLAYVCMYPHTYKVHINVSKCVC